jgi:hypothetical protein
MRFSHYLLFLLFGILLTTTITATVRGQTQTAYELQVGASGDSDSVGNSGVQAQIETNAQNVYLPDTAETFWVGDNLANGAFIQFGYELLVPGSYCLYGERIGANGNCFGSSDYVGSGDARWWWEYWPNAYGTDFYFGIGQAYSAGPDGSWHTYQIVPNVANGWNFVFDGTIVRSFNDYQVSISKDPAFVVAEEITGATSASGNLGPVEFRNLEYLNDVGWQNVTSLTAILDCNTSNQLGVYPNCGISIPYGVSMNGPNDILAGSGQNEVLAGTVLWTNSPTLTLPTLTLQVPSQVQITLDGVSQLPGEIQTALPTGAHYVSVPSFVQLSNETRLRFIEWLDWSATAQVITDPNITIILTSNHSLSTVYVTQYELTLVSSIMIGSSSFNNAPWGNWYDSDSTANFTVPTPNIPMMLVNFTASTPRILMIFDGWYDESGALVTTSQTGAILMNGPHILEARWQPNYIVLGGGFLLVITLVAVIPKRRSKAKSEDETTRPIEHEGPETALDSDENAVLQDDCWFFGSDNNWKAGTLFLTDQNWIEFVISEGRFIKRYVRDHYYHVSSVRNVRVENRQSDQPSLAIDWTYHDEELTYRYDSLDDPEKWKRKILKIKDTTMQPTSHRRKAKGPSKPAKQLCIGCGSALPKGSKYCNQCGEKQP